MALGLEKWVENRCVRGLARRPDPKFEEIKTQAKNWNTAFSKAQFDAGTSYGITVCFLR